MRVRGLALLASVLATMSATLLPATPAHAQEPDVGAYLRQHAQRNDIPGLAAVIVRDGQVVHEQTIGRDGARNPVTPRTPFLLGSVSKPVTALAVMQLIEAKQVELDAPARRYLPWFTPDDITVRQLLTHTSGIPEIATRGLTDQFDNSPGGLDKTVREVAKLDRTNVGEYQYSDGNYAVLGSIVAAVGGQPFGDYLRQHVFEPLGMRDAAATAAEAANVPPGHRRWFGNSMTFDAPYDMSGAPYGYIAASLDDMAKFTMAQLSGTPEMTLMHTGQVDTHPGRYGFGWRQSDDLVWHAGATPGFFSIVMLIPEQKTGIVVLSNVYSPAMDPALASVAFDIARILRGENPDPQPSDSLFTIALVALIAVAVALIAGIVWSIVRRKGGFVWAIACGVLAALALVGVPAAFGAGLRQVILWTPDLGWTTVAVAVSAGVLGVARGGRSLLRTELLRTGLPRTAAPVGRTASPAPDRTPADAGAQPAPGSQSPPR